MGVWRTEEEEEGREAEADGETTNPNGWAAIEGQIGGEGCHCSAVLRLDPPCFSFTRHSNHVTILRFLFDSQVDRAQFHCRVVEVPTLGEFRDSAGTKGQKCVDETYVLALSRVLGLLDGEVGMGLSSLAVDGERHCAPSSRSIIRSSPL
uniref:Uncharacterized protein n=1 Tax=Pristionchus pacificus TaxID=54126 RepID=A0A2A6CUA4_PRIPA|eukprot:PDM81698.1 hypothetical protein PRIPAC_30679 [Pristionchus pacificus]